MAIPESSNFDETNRPGDTPSRSDREKRSPDDDSASKLRSRRRQGRSRKTIDQDVVHDATLGSDAAERPKPSQTESSQPPAESSTETSPCPAVNDSVPSRYESVGEVGRGGWGVVEKAVDRQLDREVAVKRFTDTYEVTEQERQRFLHEAKVTSQLQHPGIVPVHEMGDQKDAYYVMKLLDGVTLQEFIQQHHSDKLSRTKQTRFEFGEKLEPLLQRFVDVCNAVAYAHKRGVVHRDLKPSNVMIGEFGETVVLDWGLAHSLDATPGLATTPLPARRKNVHADSTPLIEPDGTVVGTPAYMSPEQASGEISAISQPSDIYSLGMILYAIVAGRHPYQGQPVEQILKQVQSSSYPSLRSLQPLAPSALVSIVAKAMSRSPGDRYESAELLASDVRRFIAGDSVSVHQESFIEKSVRWCRHHQGIAAAVAGCASVLLVGAIVFGIVIKQSHRAEQIARIEAEQSHREAILSLGEAREATDAWLIELSGSLQFYPGMEKLRGELLERAIHQFDRLETQNLASSQTQTADSASGTASSPNVDSSVTYREHTDQLAKLERAKGALRLGDLYRLTGKPNQARTHYQAAATILRKHDQDPAPPALNVTPVSLSDTGKIDNHTGSAIQDAYTLERVNAIIGLLLLAEDTETDLPSSQEITVARRWLRSVTEPIHRDTLQSETNRSALDSYSARLISAFVRMEMALQNAKPHAHDRVDAMGNGSSFEDAVTLARWLADRTQSPRDRRLSETIQTQNCRQLADTGQHHDAWQRWSVLIDDVQRWSDSDPDRIDLLQSLGHALLQRGNCQVQLGNHENATADFDRSIRMIEKAWRLTDDDGFYRINLATAENNLGQLLATGKNRNPAMATKLLRQSLKTYEALLREGVTADRLRRYAQTHHALAVLSSPSNSAVDVVTEQAVEHAQKSASAFEILSDYVSLSVDDTLGWMHCQVTIASHHAQHGRMKPVASMLEHLRQREQQLGQTALNAVQSQTLRRVTDAIEVFEESIGATDLISTTDTDEPTDIETDLVD
ncbi:Serine/threonine-protein kinase PknD [Rubripirellula amarantea]|uniref:non-specific serine/threonine protein kinase n=1 Tax=Rubripirellula amarantea TaxID=2527999 RepID=A0A5C5WL04_9BACT|nr:serine/threonine-protein kinase [Rubripirellula amarantea]TWT51307.1 Serine/threonine-protein kinase PknD [Rubripirellula amarantea]